MGLVVMGVAWFVAAPGLGAQAIDHRAWDGLLRTHVDDGGLVDYVGVQMQRDELQTYLASLAQVETTHLEPAEQLALWINAYNACVLKGVLEHPGIASVKEVKGFFETIRYPVAGASLTLNEIEERGRLLGDWRIHFAVVCASSSCPPLRSEAYVAEQIEDQLSEQTARFLADRLRGLRVEGNTLWVSKIFKWYERDFVPSGKLTAPALLSLMASGLPPTLTLATSQPSLKLKFMDYDWGLNARSSPEGDS